MQAAQVLAGYSLGEADLLRRAMGKKKKDEMAAQRARFVDGAGKNGIAPPHANELFDLIDKFAGYGFNKSHAAAYALLSYQTAWLKAHHPVEFYAASMQFDCHLTDKLAVFVEDARRAGVVVKGPCVQASAPGFTVEGGTVRYALAGLKGVGGKAMEEVVAGRPYASLSDFAARVEPRNLNKRMIESLAAAGALDALEPNRAAVYQMADTLMAAAQSSAQAREVGQGSLLGDASAPGVELLPPRGARWDAKETNEKEREAFGFYFGGHPVDAFAAVLRAEGATRWADICAGGAAGGVSAKIGALVGACRWRTPQNGRADRRYLLADLADATGSFLGSAFDAEPQASLEKLAKDGTPALLTVELLWRESEAAPRVTVKAACALSDAVKRARLTVEVAVDRGDAIAPLRALLDERRGGRSEVVAHVATPHGRARVRLGRDFLADSELAPALMRLDGVRVLGG